MFESLYNSTGNEWDNSTFLMYCTLIFIAYLLGWLSQHSKIIVFSTQHKIYRPHTRINFFWFIIVYMVLFFVLAFRDVGTDLPTYRNIFYNSDLSVREFFGIEPGFFLLNKLIRTFTSDENVGIAVLAFIALFFVYKSIVCFANKIDISVALFAIVAMFYFQSFNLLRIYLTSYFLCYSFRFLIEDNKLKYLYCVLFAILFHYSSILMLVPVLFYYIYCKKRQLFWLGIFFLLLGFFISLNFLSILNLFERYSSYMENATDGGFGMGQFIYYLPLLLLYLYAHTRVKNKNVIDLFFVYSLFSFIFGMFGYKIMMIGRVSVYFIMLYAILIPYILRELKNNRDKNYQVIKFLTIIYILFRWHMYCSEYLYSDAIMPYKFIN